MRRFNKAKAIGLLAALAPFLALGIAEEFFSLERDKFWTRWASLAWVWFGLAMCVIAYTTAISVIRIAKQRKD